MMKAKELREQSAEELKALLLKLDQEIFGLRNQLSLHRKLEKSHELKQKRHEKARILTVLTQRQG